VFHTSLKASPERRPEKAGVEAPRQGSGLAHFAPGVPDKGGSSDEKVKTQDVVDATKIYALTVFYALNGF